MLRSVRQLAGDRQTSRNELRPSRIEREIHRPDHAMEDAPHQLSIKIEPDLLNLSRYRWMLCEGFKVVIRSPHAYQSSEEASMEAKLARKARETVLAFIERQSNP